MKKYLLLKELPGYPVGTEITPELLEGLDATFGHFLEMYSDWYDTEGIREVKYPANLKEGYLFNGINLNRVVYISKECMQGCYKTGLRFETMKEGEDRIKLKTHVALFDVRIIKGESYNIMGYHRMNNGTYDRFFIKETYIGISRVWVNGHDFIMPIDATAKELEERKQLLFDYYKLNDN